jgi:DnaJ-class molecular chaperone
MPVSEPQSKLTEGKCAACHGTGVIAVEDPAFPEKRQPPVCPRGCGTGRLVEGRSMAADLWASFKSTDGPKR